MPYHKYVFDLKKRKFLGKFEEMYQQEGIEGFDSWNQDRVNDEPHDLILRMLKGKSYARILDVGCGKGAFTNRLKELGNAKITGIDISPTAIAKAKKRYKGIKFEVKEISTAEIGKEKYNLILMVELLWYVLGNIDSILKKFSRALKKDGYFFIALFIPKNPIGKEKIRGKKDLVKLITKYFNILEVTEHAGHINILATKQ